MTHQHRVPLFLDCPAFLPALYSLQITIAAAPFQLTLHSYFNPKWILMGEHALPQLHEGQLRLQPNATQAVHAGGTRRRLHLRRSSLRAIGLACDGASGGGTVLQDQLHIELNEAGPRKLRKEWQMNTVRRCSRGSSLSPNTSTTTTTDVHTHAHLFHKLHPALLLLLLHLLLLPDHLPLRSRLLLPIAAHLAAARRLLLTSSAEDTGGNQALHQRRIPAAAAAPIH